MRNSLWFACIAASVSSCQRYDDRHHALSDIHWSLTSEVTGQAPVQAGMESDLSPEKESSIADGTQAKKIVLYVRFALHHPNGQRYRYMVYYRNETYKFPEADKSGRQDPLAEENFYGAWTDGWHLSEPSSKDGVTVLDHIAIRSDPRDELPHAHWGRNPRTGNYSLLVVAIAADDFNASPPDTAVQDVRVKAAGHFVEPYWYWLHGPGHQRPDAAVEFIDNVLTLNVELETARGVHGCGGDQGDFEPFLHYIDPASRFENIPVVADVLANGFSNADYDSLLCFTPRDRMISTLPSVATDPCLNARVDTMVHCLEIHNPPAAIDHPGKENTGVRSRLALTYGRFRVHAQLSPLLNDSDLWNGLTNAVWLIGANAEGVSRRVCDGGYIAYAGDGGEARRIARSKYAEIDFEIMKGMPLCPERAFPPIYPQSVVDPRDRSAWLRKLPLEVLEQRGRVAVACTNWDLACPDPPSFGIGCQDIALGTQVFTSHRWDRDYRAITQKSMEANDELFGAQGYWFEIDWRPQEIFWRIGLTLDNMRTVGYMNSSMTSIPNVPMWLVISQEFHNTNWWPGSPYEQGGIPFPKKDLVGRIFEVRVD